jgi:flagellar protein FlaG
MRIEQLGSTSQEAVTADKLPGSGLTQSSEDPLHRPGRVPVPADADADVQRIKQAVQQFVQPVVPALEFSTDAETGRMVVKIMDSATGEVVRQIPMEEMLALTKSLDRLQGLLFHTKA